MKILIDYEVVNTMLNTLSEFQADHRKARTVMARHAVADLYERQLEVFHSYVDSLKAIEEAKEETA